MATSRIVIRSRPTHLGGTKPLGFRREAAEGAHHLLERPIEAKDIAVGTVACSRRKLAVQKPSQSEAASTSRDDPSVVPSTILRSCCREATCFVSRPIERARRHPAGRCETSHHNAVWCRHTAVTVSLQLERPQRTAADTE